MTKNQVWMDAFSMENITVIVNNNFQLIEWSQNHCQILKFTQNYNTKIKIKHSMNLSNKKNKHTFAFLSLVRLWLIFSFVLDVRFATFTSFNFLSCSSSHWTNLASDDLKSAHCKSAVSSDT